MAARFEAGERRREAMTPVTQVPILAPRMSAIAPGKVMIWLIPMATINPVTAELLCITAVAMVPAIIPER